MKSFILLALVLCANITSCSSSLMNDFERMYAQKSYSAALAQGELIIEEQGLLRDMWINFNSDAKQAHYQFLQKMLICIEHQKIKHPSHQLNILQLQLKNTLNHTSTYLNSYSKNKIEASRPQPTSTKPRGSNTNVSKHHHPSESKQGNNSVHKAKKSADNAQNARETKKPLRDYFLI